MNLIIIHGNGLSAISNKLVSIKKGFESLDILTINAQEKSLNAALMEILTGQLFSQKRLVVLEDFEDFDLDKLPDGEDITIVFRINEALDTNSPLLKSAGKHKTQIFQYSEKDETSIFPFLDNLAEKKAQVFVDLEKYLNEWGGQYVLTMIFYLLRRMVIPAKKLPEFVAKKIERQKKNFSLERMNQLYKDAIETDFKIKSGLIEEKTAIVMLVNNIIA